MRFLDVFSGIGGFRMGLENSEHTCIGHIERTSQYSMAVPVMVLRDEFGFGKKRLDKFLDSYMELYDAIEEGYLNLDDIIKTLNEETSVEIVKR